MSVFVILILGIAVLLVFTAVILVLIFLTAGLAFLSFRRPRVVPQSRNPVKTPGDIQHALQLLLDATPAGKEVGFVIFHGHRDLDFVQFVLDPNGLLLDWPTIQTDGLKRLPMVLQQLELLGFRKVAPCHDGMPLSEQIASLQVGQFLILDDGLYAQTGRNAASNYALTIALLRDVFGVADMRLVEITLEPHG